MSLLRFTVCSFLVIALESCCHSGEVDTVYCPFDEHTNSSGEERHAGIKKTVRPQPANTHWLWFSPPMVPCSQHEKVRSGPNLWEPRATPALPCWPPLCWDYKAGGVSNRDRDYTPESKTRVSIAFLLPVQVSQASVSYSGMLEQRSVLSLERFDVSLCGGVQFIRKKKPASCSR